MNYKHESHGTRYDCGLRWCAAVSPASCGTTYPISFLKSWPKLSYCVAHSPNQVIFHLDLGLDVPARDLTVSSIDNPKQPVYPSAFYHHHEKCATYTQWNLVVSNNPFWLFIFVHQRVKKSSKFINLAFNFPSKISTTKKNNNISNTYNYARDH